MFLDFDFIVKFIFIFVIMLIFNCFVSSFSSFQSDDFHLCNEFISVVLMTAFKKTRCACGRELGQKKKLVYPKTRRHLLKQGRSAAYTSDFLTRPRGEVTPHASDPLLFRGLTSQPSRVLTSQRSRSPRTP